MSLTVTSFNDALKHLYTDQRLEMMAYKRNPFHAMLPKMEGFYGDQMPIPIIFANPQSRSRTFATAQTKSTAASGSTTSVKAFQLERVKDYGVVTIDNEAMEASENNAGAFMAARKTEIDGILNSLIRSLAIAEFRGAYGKLGAIGSILTSPDRIVLSPIDEVTNFEKGMDITCASGEASGALRSSAAILTITNVDRTTGTLTLSAGVAATWSGATAGDVLFADGDRDAGASPSMSKVAGVEAWVPTTAPTSTTFFGVDRSVDTRLGGLRLDRTGYSYEEALVDGMSLVAREGGQPDKAFTSYGTYASIEKSLIGRVQYVDLQVNADVSFPGIRVNGPSGYVDVTADQNCPTNRIYILELDSWKLCSLKKAPRIIGSDGLEMIRQSNADGVEVRAGYYANVACDAPGYNINVKVS